MAGFYKLQGFVIVLTLVTGATGLVGNNVCRMLLERGEAVRVLTRSSSAQRPLANLPVEVALGDVRDANEVDRAMLGVNRVVHAAAHVRIGWSERELMEAINVAGTQHVAAAARRHQATLVHVSSVDALGVATTQRLVTEDEPGEQHVACPYVLTKQRAEEVVLTEVKNGLHASIVNPGFMLGPWDWRPSSGSMLLGMARHPSPVAPRGGCSTCDVRDVAHAILVALERGVPGRRYILAGENLSYLELWRIMATTAGVRPPRFRMGPLIRWASGAVGDVIGKITGTEPVVNSAAIAMSSQYHYYSSDRARAELNYRPRPAAKAVAEAWAWFQQMGYVKA